MIGVVVNAPESVGSSQKRPPAELKVQYSNVPGEPVDLQTFTINSGLNTLDFDNAIATRYVRLQLEKLTDGRQQENTFLNG